MKMHLLRETHHHKHICSKEQSIVLSVRSMNTAGKNNIPRYKMK